MRRPSVLAVGCALLVVLALLAVGASGARSGAWLWPVAVPGDRAPLGAALRDDAVRAGVAAGSLRELATSGEGAARLTLLAGKRGGETVLATETGARLGTVERVPEATSPLRAFSTPDGRVVGVARGDVGRVVAVLGDGRAVELPLSAWRAFAYDDGEPAVTLTAYDLEGRSLGSLGLPPTPKASVRIADQWRGSGTVPQLYGAFMTGRIRSGTALPPPATLARVDPRTLKRIPGPSLEIPSPGVLALSPSGQRLAIASPPSSAVDIVDLGRMRSIRRWRAGAGPWSLVRILAWPREDRLLEVVQRMSKPYARYVRARSLVVVDPAIGRVVTRRKLTNKLGITGSMSAGGRLVMLMQSSSYRGSTALLVVASADGDVRQATVKVGGTRRVRRFNQLVVTPAGDRAYVVVSGGLVVDVDLDSLEATYHQLRPPAQTPRGLPVVIGPRAAMLGRDIAFAGVFGGPSGVPPLGGTYLVDTDSWKVRVLDPRATFFAAGGDVLATFGPAPFVPAAGPPRGRGIGLSVFDAEGRLRFHLYGTRRLESVELVLGYGHALVGVGTPRLSPGRIYSPVWTDRVFDLGTGRALGARRLTRQPYLIYRGSPSVGEVPTSSSKSG
jgi:hypothetical protein